jgi:hypothetical protein
MMRSPTGGGSVDGGAGAVLLPQAAIAAKQMTIPVTRSMKE